MIDYKAQKQIDAMQKGGQILSRVLHQTLERALPGVTEMQLDSFADQKIRELGGFPGFRKVAGWHHAVCMSVNDVVVHGIPTDYSLKENDVVGIDCGVFLDGLHTDMSETIRIKNGKPVFYTGEETTTDKIDLFLSTGKRALNEAIRAAVPGNRIGDISRTIQTIVEKQAHYSVVRSLIGHGVGKKLHEEPEVPGYVHMPIGKTPLLKEGMTIAIEIIYNMGSYGVVIDRDGWTIRTEDRSLSGLFERTIAITQDGPLNLTAH